MAVKLEYAPGATPLDSDDAAGLLESHITTQAQLNEWEQANVVRGQEWALSNRNREDPLTSEFVRKLHAAMFDRTWAWAGTFRKKETTIGVAPAQIAVRLKDLLDNTRYWLVNRVYPTDAAVVRLHHRLVRIHPFPNGNGRHARMMADVLMARHNEKLFTWGRANLSQQGSARERYIAALRGADASQDDIEALLEFARS